MLSQRGFLFGEREWEKWGKGRGRPASGDRSGGREERDTERKRKRKKREVGGVSPEGPQLVLTTVIPFCKGSQITSSVQDLRNAEQITSSVQDLRNAEQITSLIQGLRNAEQRYLRLEQGQPYLAARQGIYGLAIETKKERIARPETHIKRGSS